MRKRPHDDCGLDISGKRPRFDIVDRLSLLSDELLLRILSFVPIPTLTLCPRCVCKPSICTERLISEECLGVLRLLLVILSSGSRRITTALSVLEPLASLVSKTRIFLQIVCFILQGSPNGLRKIIWFSRARGRTGKDNTSYGTIGQEAAAMSARSKLQKGHPSHHFWLDCTKESS